MHIFFFGEDRPINFAETTELIFFLHSVTFPQFAHKTSQRQLSAGSMLLRCYWLVYASLLLFLVLSLCGRQMSAQDVEIDSTLGFYKEEKYALLKAAQIGDIEVIIQEKTKQNGNLNIQDEDGLTAVMVATKWNQVQALQLVSN